MKEWTVMVYMAGNNNLSEDMVTGLKGMQLVTNDKNVNLLSAYESSGSSLPIPVFEFTNEKRNQPLNSNVVDHLPTYSRLGSKPQWKIVEFVKYVLEKEQYAAKKYALIISGHGDGILGKNLLRTNTSASKLTLPELRKILGKARSRLGNRKKFDLLGFDSCLMNMIEVANEFQNVGEILVASEGHIPTSGWPYDKVLSELMKNKGTMSGKDFAKSIVKQFVKFQSEYVRGGRSVSISACDLSKSSQLAEAVSKLAEILSDTLSMSDQKSAYDTKIVRNKVRNLILTTQYYSQAYMHDQATDVLDFASALKKESEVLRREIAAILGNTKLSPVAVELLSRIDHIQLACKQIESVCQNYVISQGSCGPEYQFSTGASIFLPWTRTSLNLVRTLYENLQFARQKGNQWLNFIDCYTRETFRHGVLVPATDAHLRFGSVGHKEVDAREYIGKEHSAREHAGREHGGKEHGGKEYIGRGFSIDEDFETFLQYFRRVRNYQIYSNSEVDDLLKK